MSHKPDGRHFREPRMRVLLMNMTAPRDRVPRPEGGSYAFACTRCLLVHRDGVDYTWCPRCSHAVDWIDERAPVWACTRCDRLVTGPAAAPACDRCAAPMRVIASGSPADARARAEPAEVITVPRMARAALIALVIVQTVLALADPDAFPYLGPLLALAQLFGTAVIILVVAVSRDIRTLFDVRTRLVHGLEHATINVLAERGLRVTSGVTERGEFVLCLDADGRAWHRLDEIRAAALDAIQRVIAGEHALAYSAHCGTSYVVALCLSALAVVVAGIAALALGVPTGIAWALTVATGGLARLIARPAGLWAQRTLTVSVDLASATLRGIERRASSDGDQVIVVIALEVVPRARHGGPIARDGFTFVCL